MIESKINHSHHHSVALNSPQINNVVSSSTGSTRELKMVTNRIPGSQSKNKVNKFKDQKSPIRMNKDSVISDQSDQTDQNIVSNRKTAIRQHEMSKQSHWCGFSSLESCCYWKHQQIDTVSENLQSERFKTISELLNSK